MIARMSPARIVVRALVLVLVLTTPAAAQIVRWVDDQGNAHYADGMLNVPERYRARAQPLEMRNAPAPPPGPAPTLPGPPVAAGGVTIRFTPGQRIIVDVRLNGRTPARLLLDTGADRTLINPQALSAAGVQLSRAVARGEMRGVTGRDEVLYVLLDSLEIGSARIERILVAAYEIGSRETDGLLGRDVLEQFNLSIDSTRGVVTLSPK
jgi:predicted aspartyl protease